VVLAKMALNGSFALPSDEAVEKRIAGLQRRTVYFLLVCLKLLWHFSN
jgi:hypothetical protein